MINRKQGRILNLIKGKDKKRLDSSVG